MELFNKILSGGFKIALEVHMKEIKVICWLASKINIQIHLSIFISIKLIKKIDV